MSPNSCPFCEQVNPADAKFCNACGGALHLLPCPRCGAVSDVTATTCYQCHSQLPGRGTDEHGTAAPVAEVSKALPRRTSRVIVGTAVLAAIAVLGYYTYSQRSLVVAPQPPAASSEAAGSGGPAGTAVVGGDAAAGDSARAKSDEGDQTESPAVLPPETPLADRADQQPEEARRPSAAAGLITRPRPGGAGKAGGQAPARQDVCTDAVAALGLCTMTPEDRELAEDVAAVNAVKARPEVADSGKAGAQGPADACTEAVAALGLCAPAPTRKQGE